MNGLLYLSSIILGNFDETSNDRLIIHHLPIFKLHVLKSREKNTLPLESLLSDTRKYKRVEKNNLF